MPRRALRFWFLGSVRPTLEAVGLALFYRRPLDGGPAVGWEAAHTFCQPECDQRPANLYAAANKMLLSEQDFYRWTVFHTRYL